MRTVRVTAKTVEAAVEDGIKQLGISREEAIVHVVEQPSGGLFGLIHKKPAVVDVSAVDEPEAEETPEAPKAEETPAEEPKAEETKEEPAKEGTEEAAEAPAEAAEESKEPEETESKETEENRLTKKAEKKPRSMRKNRNRPLKKRRNSSKRIQGHAPQRHHGKMMNEDRILLSLHGEGLGILIGKHGQTLDALQYLTNLAAGKSFRHHYFVMLDVENYRERRQDTLEALAHRLAGKARRTGEPVKLEPMPAGERRIIHLALQDDPSVSTESEGEAPYRYVVISPNR